jgi:predicted site-specific integrase-resolvase
MKPFGKGDVMEELVPLLNSKSVAQILGVSEATLSRWRATKKGPPFLDLEGNPRYLTNDIKIWFDEKREVNAA